MKTFPTHAFILCAAIQFVLASQAAAEDGSSVDKRGYSLFRPVPADQLRELSTDRPDKTESPYTVDAGHFQIELDFVSFTRDSSRAATTESWSFLPANFKVGLLHNLDLQIVTETFNHVRERSNGSNEVRNGFGDITSRLKFNLWGNDGGDTALALMPFVKFPTNRDDLGNDSVEGGLIIPLAVSLPDEWSLGLMTELDINRDETDDGNHVEFVNSATVSHALYGDLNGYAEIFTAKSNEHGTHWIVTGDTGLTYGLTADSQLDCGVNVGLTGAADDIQLFLGFTQRI